MPPKTPQEQKPKRRTPWVASPVGEMNPTRWISPSCCQACQAKLLWHQEVPSQTWTSSCDHKDPWHTLLVNNSQNHHPKHHLSVHPHPHPSHQPCVLRHYPCLSRSHHPSKSPSQRQCVSRSPSLYPSPSVQQSWSQNRSRRLSPRCPPLPRSPRLLRHLPHLRTRILKMSRLPQIGAQLEMVVIMSQHRRLPLRPTHMQQGCPCICRRQIHCRTRTFPCQWRRSQCKSQCRYRTQVPQTQRIRRRTCPLCPWHKLRSRLLVPSTALSMLPSPPLSCKFLQHTCLCDPAIPSHTSHRGAWYGLLKEESWDLTILHPISVPTMCLYCSNKCRSETILSLVKSTKICIRTLSAKAQ
mmetsp:Transcript_24413/g.41920  ORF Transcript_24413/g.41920 Transcript_24413/m.41920 type:complete len:354 (+) Transcript_24413:318-1379(+)